MVSYKPHCVSPIGCVPKKNGKWRIIVDLRGVNKFCAVQRFQNEDIRTAMKLVRDEDYMISLDISNGFLHVPVRAQDQKFLGVRWRGRYYVWKALPFGLSCSPYYFAKILRPVIQHLREGGLRVMTFVDDFLLCAGSDDIIIHRDSLIQTLRNLGWQINIEKSSLDPQKEIQYLGYVVQSVGPEGPFIQVTNERLRKLKKDISRALKLQ